MLAIVAMVAHNETHMARINHITTTTRHKRTLRPLRLHHLLGHETVWTDPLWDEAMAYLDGRLSLPQAITLSQTLTLLDGTLHADSLALVSFVKRDRLSLFRDYPPSTLVAAFDHCRITLWK